MRWLWLIVINWLCLCGVAQGQSLTNTFVFPVGADGSMQGYSILQGFNTPRNQGYCSNNPDFGTIQNCTGTWRYGHDGIDINGNGGGNSDCGDPVYASAIGTVIFAGWVNGWGNVVRIRHNTSEGMRYTIYAHLQDFVPNMVNHDVQKGQRIGSIGNGGVSTACHLHFGVTTENRLGPGYVYGNPMPAYLLDPSQFIRNHNHPPYEYSPFLNPYVCDNPPTADANWWYSCNRRTDFNLGQSVYGLMRLDNTYVPHTYKVRVYRNSAFQWQQISGRYQGMDPQWGWRYSFFAPVIVMPVAGDWELRFYVDIGNGFQQDDAPMAVSRFRVIGGNNAQLAAVPASPASQAPAQPQPAAQAPPNGFIFNSDNNTNPTTCDNEPTSPGAPNWIYSCNRRTVFNRGERVYAMFRIDEVFRDPQFKLEGYRNGNREYSWTGNTIAVDHVSGWRHVYTWPQVNNLQPGHWELRYFVNSGNGFPAIPTATTQIDVIDVLAAPFTYDGNKTTCTGPVTGGANTNWVYTCQNPRQTFSAGQTVYAMIRLDRILADFSTHVDIYRNNQLQWGYDTPVNDVDEQWGWEKTFQWATIPNVTPGDWEVRIFVRPPNSPTATASLLFHVNP